MELIIASQNPNKIEEIQLKLPSVLIRPLPAEKFPDELVENSSSLEGNALQKLRQVYDVLKENCFADDTGLEIQALNGEPGVFSARYAGDEKNSEANMQKVLDALKQSADRSAQFRTVIALNWKAKEYVFEGICKGEIAKEKMGNKGFGYDPIFVPEGFNKSFAQMSMHEKNMISHRARAVQQLVQFIESDEG